MIKTLRQAVAAVTATLAVGVAQAAPVSYLLQGQFDTGPVSTSFSATFSYDLDLLPTGSGAETLALDDWLLSIFGTSYDASQAFDVPLAHFVDGVFTGIEALYEFSTLSLSFVDGAGVFDPYVAYQTENNEFGEGSYTVRAAQQLPEPASLALALGGLGLAGLAARRRRVH